MNGLPREARDGLMRAWLAILRERHPHYTWIAMDRDSEAELATVDLLIASGPEGSSAAALNAA